MDLKGLSLAVCLCTDGTNYICVERLDKSRLGNIS